MKYLRLWIILPLLSLACNKTSNQLPVINAPSDEIVIPVAISGSQKLEAIFSRVTVKGHDSVFISLKNVSGRDIDSITLMVELCKALPHNYDNCYMETAIPVGRIQADSTAGNIFRIIDKKIDFDSSTVNIHILSVKYSGQSVLTHPLAGIYGSGLLRFFDTAITWRDSTWKDTVQTTPDIVVADSTTRLYDTSRTLKYYGDMRGYVDIDGRFMLRMKAVGPVLYNAGGKFDDTSSIRDGRLTMNGQLVNVIKASPPPPGLPAIYLDGNKLSFSLHLEKPLEAGSIDSISVNATKQ